MGIDNEEDHRLRRAEKRHKSKGAPGFPLPLWEDRAAKKNQRFLPLPAPPPTLVALPAPEALPALPAPPLDEGMVVYPEAERWKRPREELDVDAQPTSGNEDAGAQSGGHHGQQHGESRTVDLLLAMATTSVQSSQEVHVEDDTVTLTRTDVVVQRAPNVEASQSTTADLAAPL